MRISDWSSDVCSSDLHDGRGRHQHALIGEPVGLFIAGIAVVPFDPAPVDLVSLRGSIERLPQILVLDRLPVGSLPATRLPVDRTSVVSGKSVSVSVELGGCRSLKKKKTKKRRR